MGGLSSWRMSPGIQQQTPRQVRDRWASAASEVKSAIGQGRWDSRTGCVIAHGRLGVSVLREELSPILPMCHLGRESMR